MAERRKILVEQFYDVQKSLGRRLFTLSAGSFGVTFAFIDRLVPDVSANNDLLITGWTLLVVSILLQLLSHFASFHSFKNEIDIHDGKYNNRKYRREWRARKIKLTGKWRKNYNKARFYQTAIMNYLAFFAFAAGLLYILRYVSSSLN